MRFAYADPPYPGQAWRVYGHGTDPKNPGRVEPDKSIRVMAWVKPGGAPFPVAVQYGWEPVILRGGRRKKYGRTWDYLVAQPERYTFRPQERPAGHVKGAKPRVFCEWIFRALGARPGDELVDLFPGSGAVGRAWDRFVSQPELAPAAAYDQLEMTGT